MSKMGNQDWDSGLSHSYCMLIPQYRSPLHISFVVTLITFITEHFLKLCFPSGKMFTNWVAFYQETSHHINAWVGKKSKCLALEFEKRKKQNNTSYYSYSVPFFWRVPKVLQMLNAPVREINWKSLSCGLSSLWLLGSNRSTHIWISALCQQWALNCLNYFLASFNLSIYETTDAFLLRTIKF